MSTPGVGKLFESWAAVITVVSNEGPDHNKNDDRWSKVTLFLVKNHQFIMNDTQASH